jgi:hypothetical protein
VTLSEAVPRNEKKAARVFLLLFLAGAAIRAVDVFRPADGRIRESWRESDYAAVARNFAREGMNILEPRIDWRGNGPGFAEMEFPIIPWATAVFYRIFGVHEEIGRAILWFVSLLALLVFFALARRLLPFPAAAAAGLFFVLSPLSVRVSNSLQPEGLMLLLILLGVHFFLRWLDEGFRRHYWLSLLATAGAILAKAPAAHIGLVLAALLIAKKGFRAFRRVDVWIFGVLALLPAAAWYAHAHRFYLEFGLSLGLSNETHWLGWDLLRSPGRFLSLALGAIRTESLYVWTPLGWIFLGAAFFLRKRTDVFKVVFWWLAGIGVYFLAAIRTIGDGWAAYYHVVVVPPAALAIGAAVDGLIRRRPSDMLRFERRAVAAGLALVFGFQAFLVVRDFHPRIYEPFHACSETFAPSIPEGDLILTTGGRARDETGRPVAYNAPYFFYWLDRKGWNIPLEGASPEAVREFARRGARYFVCERSFLSWRPGLEEGLRGAFPVVAECSEAILFRIGS